MNLGANLGAVARYIGGSLCAFYKGDWALTRYLTLEAALEMARAAWKLDEDEWVRTRWFGASWGAPICQPETHVPIPLGAACGGCSAVIGELDSGLVLPFAGGPEDPPAIAYHLGCFSHLVGIDGGSWS